MDEYPGRALREALVNAVAHRNYEDGARKITVRVFSNRIEIASPGYPPKPLTLAKLRKGNYRPASRNPLIAQALATFQLMEQRGSGFARMREANRFSDPFSKPLAKGTVRPGSALGTGVASLPRISLKCWPLAGRKSSFRPRPFPSSS